MRVRARTGELASHTHTETRARARACVRVCICTGEKASYTHKRHVCVCGCVCVCARARVRAGVYLHRREGVVHDRVRRRQRAHRGLLRGRGGRRACGVCIGVCVRARSFVCGSVCVCACVDADRTSPRTPILLLLLSLLLSLLLLYTYCGPCRGQAPGKENTIYIYIYISPHLHQGREVADVAHPLHLPKQHNIFTYFHIYILLCIRLYIYTSDGKSPTWHTHSTCQSSTMHIYIFICTYIYTYIHTMHKAVNAASVAHTRRGPVDILGPVGPGGPRAVLPS